MADLEPPEGGQSQFIPDPLPALEAQAAAFTEQRKLAEFVIADQCMQPVSEPAAELAETFRRALQRSLVAHPHKGRVAAIIAQGKDMVRFSDPGHELIEKRIVIERMPEPKEMAVCTAEQSLQRIWQIPVLVVVSTQLLGRPGVVDVAEDGKAMSLGHGRNGCPDEV